MLATRADALALVAFRAYLQRTIGNGPAIDG
ncbi:hypothetical protein BRAS3809_7990014 [Bradyrhizobium sp. STM 3809]|nr:hypothetical protein BRAS3809_7990014 [Bradyrhizobium sp. STM 3809]